MNHGQGTDVYLQVAEAVAVRKATKTILHRYAYIQIARHAFDILCARIIHRSYCVDVQSRYERLLDFFVVRIFVVE